MKLVKAAERIALRLIVTVAILAPVTLTVAPVVAHAQWAGGPAGVEWQWTPAINARVPLAAVPYPYGYAYYGVPDNFQPGYAYQPTYGFPGNAYSGYGNAYASGYAQGYGDGYGHGYDNGYAGGYGSYPPIHGNGYPGNGYLYPY